MALLADGETIRLGGSGYTLYFGDDPKTGESLVTLYPGRDEFPAMTIAVNQLANKVRTVNNLQINGVTKFFNDRDGDGLPDDVLVHLGNGGGVRKYRITVTLEGSDSAAERKGLDPSEDVKER